MQKGPSSVGWNLRENVITAPQAALLLAGKNIGLAHAFCTPTPTCAIDLDNCKESKKWLAKEGIDLGLLLHNSDAAVIWSGKQNSLKLLYRLPKEVGAPVSRQVHGPDGTMMLGFRCAAKNGTTLQDLLPPQRSSDGYPCRVGHHMVVRQRGGINLVELGLVQVGRDDAFLEVVQHQALLHGSRFGRGYPNPTVVYATTTAVRTEFGRPAVSMRLSTATATVASVH